MDKIVLIVAYFFPPWGGANTLRTFGFAHHLLELGWQPVVLTVSNSPYPMRDLELAKYTDRLPVHTAPTVEPEHLYNLYRKFWPLSHSSQRAVQTDYSESRPSIAARLQTMLFLPDGRIGWYPCALAEGKKILRQYHPAAIWSTAPPYTAHLIAQWLARSSGLPWVIDLQDMWVGNPFEYVPTRLHRRIQMWMERSCVQSARQVICATSVMSEEMRARYPDQPAHKFTTITNGYDRADYMAGLVPAADRFLIRYVGSLYGRQSPLPFLRGLSLALARRPDMRQYIQVEFIGMMDQANRQSWESWIQAHDWGTWIIGKPFVPHQQAIRLMQTAQVQLLILASGEEMKGVLTSKIFEYLGAQRPVLCIAPPGLAAELVRETQAGLVADPEDVDSIAGAILQLDEWFQAGKLQNWSPKGIEAYDRRHLTAQLASVLETVVA